eukprot:32836_1
MSQEETERNTELLSLLKVNGEGWNIAVFQEQNKISAVLCKNCNAVSCDGVELGCEHDDNDIYLYCNKCLRTMVKQNNNKCPIDSHANPVIIASRSSRRLVLNATVCCINNGHTDCQWSGTFNELLNNHLYKCVDKYNPSFINNIKMKKLQNENQKLNDIISSKEHQIKQQFLEINKLKN